MNLLDISTKYLSIEPDKLLRVNKLYEWVLVQFEDSDDGISYFKENLSGKELEYALELHEAQSTYMGIPVYYSNGNFSAPRLGIYSIKSKPILKSKIREIISKSNLRIQKSNQIRKSLKPKKIKENLENTDLKIEEKDKNDPCWKGFTQVGMKKKGNKEVPNCVPSKNVSKSKNYKEEIEFKEAQFILKNVLECNQIELKKQSNNKKKFEDIQIDENLELFVRYCFFAEIVENIEEMNELLSTISEEDYNYIVNEAVKKPAGTQPAGTPPAGTQPAGTQPAGTPPAGNTTTTGQSASNDLCNTCKPKYKKPTVESNEMLKTKKINNIIINPSKDEDMTAGEKLNKKSIKIASKLKENFSLEIDKKLIIDKFINVNKVS